MSSRVLRAAFVAFLVAVAAHIGFVVAHEPFAFDAWNIAQDTGAQPFTLGRFATYIADQYTTSNPRIGQWFAYLAYKLDPFAVVATPLAFLALALAVSVLGLGRWPRWRHGRELALVAFATGALWFALPRIGMLLFCRAYATNYVYTAAIQLWFLVPLRLGAIRGSPRALAAYAAAGVLAGMCNEHTGPTLILFLAGYAVWRQRETPDAGRPTLVWAGALGAFVGFAAIFFAPGQRSGRYEGLAEQVGFVERLLQRGVVANLDIYRDYLTAAMPALALIVVALIAGRADPATPARRRALQLVGLALLAGSLITATVFVSPKLGWRFYLHGCALLLAGVVAVADATLTTPRRLAPFVALAVAAAVYAGVRTAPLYARMSVQSDERLAALVAARPGDAFTALSFDQAEDSWWSLGDDFRDIKKRELIARYFALRSVVFRAVEIEAPLGVSDVRLVARAQLTPPGALEDHGGLQLASFRGIDVRAMHVAVAAGLTELRHRLAAGRVALDQLELAVAFVGAAPALPRPRLLAARWTPAGYEGWSAVIRRGGVAATRALKLPPELAALDAEIYVYRVGDRAERLGTTRDRSLTYRPWGRGAYWGLACPPGRDHCFVIAATRVR